MYYRIFISHAWSYNSAYKKIECFLKKEGVLYYNHSIPKDDPVHTDGTEDQLYRAIEAKIKGCSCVIILAGIYATYSKWIKKEIKIAKKYKKPIIAIQPRGAQYISSVAKSAASTIVKWNAKSISNAVYKYAL